MKRRDKKSGRKERFSHIRKLYDSFTVKDMTFEEFERAYNAEMSPVRMRNELKELIRYRGQQRTQRLIADQSRKQIDGRIQEN